MGTFAIDVERWGNQAMQKFEQLRKRVVLSFFSSVIKDTPVLSGRLRGNWQIASTPVDGVLEITDPEGNRTVKKVEAFLKTQDAGEDNAAFLTNNLPYAYRIEYDGWSHEKAPAGMVRKNFIRISENLKRKYG